MKKIALILTLLLLCAPAFAIDRTVTNTEISGYIVSVEESSSALRVNVRSTSPYGVFLQYSKSKSSYAGFQNVRYLTAVFDVAPEINASQGIKASDVYSVKIPKGKKDKIVLTVKTGNLTNMQEQVIWEDKK